MKEAGAWLIGPRLGHHTVPRPILGRDGRGQVLAVGVGHARLLDLLDELPVGLPVLLRIRQAVLDLPLVDELTHRGPLRVLPELLDVDVHQRGEEVLRFLPGHSKQGRDHRITSYKKVQVASSLWVITKGDDFG